MKHLKPYPKPSSTSGSGAGGTKPKKPQSNSRKGIVIIALLLKWSGIGAVSGSGKLAGTVMNIGGASGPSARVWAKPRIKRTAFTQLVKGLFSGLSTAFRTLTSTQIDAWNTAANNTNPTALRSNVFGDQKVVTGAQLFQRVNNILASLGLPSYALPPLAGIADTITAATLAAGATLQTLTLDLTFFSGAVVVPANSYIKVYATAQRGASVSAFGESQYRFIGFYPAAAVSNPLNIAPDWSTRFGLLILGQRLAVKAHLVFDDGAGTFSKGGDVYATTVVV